MSCRLISRWKKHGNKFLREKNPALKKISLMTYNAEKNLTPLYVGEKISNFREVWEKILSWLFDYHRMLTLKQRLTPKKGALFSLIYFFGSFCIYYIPHNYVTPQAMPHAIPPTHSAFYLHRDLLNNLSYANCFWGLTYGFLNKNFQEIKLFICHS